MNPGQIEYRGTIYTIQEDVTPSARGTIQGALFVPERLIVRMHKLEGILDAEYISEITRSQEDKPQYKNEHKSYKSGGGGRSPAIKLIEVVIDFHAAMDQHRYDEALISYYYLKRTLSL